MSYLKGVMALCCRKIWRINFCYSAVICNVSVRKCYSCTRLSPRSHHVENIARDQNVCTRVYSRSCVNSNVNEVENKNAFSTMAFAVFESTKSNFLTEFLDESHRRFAIGCSPRKTNERKTSTKLKTSKITSLLYETSQLMKTCNHFPKATSARINSTFHNRSVALRYRNGHNSSTIGIQSLPCVPKVILTDTESNFFQSMTCFSKYLKCDDAFNRNNGAAPVTVNIAKSDPMESSQESNKPTKEQLLVIENVLVSDLPKIFRKPLNYSIYHPNVVFHNNIKGVVIKGIKAYVNHISAMKIMSRFYYAYINMKLLKVTIHPEDSTVRVRWTITCISTFKACSKLLKNWKSNMKELVDSDGISIDGFSIFYVGNDGLVYKHICDKMMPDDEKEVLKPNKLGLKLALSFGGILPESFHSIQDVLSVKTTL